MKELTFSEYAEKAKMTFAYPLAGKNMVYPATKMAGESGELADKIGKHWRNNNILLLQSQTEDFACLKAMSSHLLSDEEKKQLLIEAGDVLWYINAIAIELGSSLEEIAKLNNEKTLGRKERGTVLGHGDNR